MAGRPVVRIARVVNMNANIAVVEATIRGTDARGVFTASPLPLPLHPLAYPAGGTGGVRVEEATI